MTSRSAFLASAMASSPHSVMKQFNSGCTRSARAKMDLRRLRYFVAVAEERSVGRAAVRLRMAQPPLSVQIRKLESEVGTPLFRRGARGMELTAAGRALLSRAREALALTAEGFEAARAVAAGR